MQIAHARGLRTTRRLMYLVALAGGCKSHTEPMKQIPAPSVRWAGNALILGGSAVGQVGFNFSGFELTATAAGLPEDSVIVFGGKRERVKGGGVAVTGDVTAALADLSVNAVLAPDFAFVTPHTLAIELPTGAHVEPALVAFKGFDLAAAFARIKSTAIVFPGESSSMRANPAGALVIAKYGTQLAGNVTRVRDIDYVVLAEDKAIQNAADGPACPSATKAKSGTVALTTLTFYERVNRRVATQVDVFGEKLCGADAGKVPTPPPMAALVAKVGAELTHGIAPQRQDLKPRL
jgi:hypothetical protein